MTRSRLHHLAASAVTSAGVLLIAFALAGDFACAQEQPAVLLKPQITQWVQPPVAAAVPGSAPAHATDADTQTHGNPSQLEQKRAVMAPTQVGPAQRPAVQPSAATPAAPRAAAAAPPVSPAISAAQPGAVQPRVIPLEKPASLAQPVARPGTAASVPAPAGRSTAAPVIRHDFGAVQRLLEFQASGSHAGPPQWLSGRDATASYQRFLTEGKDAASVGGQQRVGEYGLEKQPTQSKGVQVAPAAR